MERTQRLKKILKIIAVSAAALLVLLTALSFIKIPFNKYWKTQKVLNSPITKISLLTYGYNQRYGDRVEFSDSDLIQKWVDYFNSADIQHSVGLDAYVACFICGKDGGFYNMVTVYSEDSEFTLIFYGTSELEFWNSLRHFNVSGAENPFDETFNEAEKRYGIIDSWSTA